MVAAVTVVALAVAALLPPVAQDPAYHGFADRRGFLGVPNFWNVASNLPFLLVGAFGLRAAPGLPEQLPRPAYLLFCIGAILVGIGSAWYHYAPANATLVWDRLPMTMAFMALFSIIIQDWSPAAPAGRLLWPLVIVGVCSVLYWDWTELEGRGDLRAYGLVQFLPMLLMPLMLLTRSGGGLRAPWLWATLLTYGLAKLAEHYDAAVYAATGLVSGHSLKHLLGALAVYSAIRAMHPARLTTVAPCPQSARCSRPSGDSEDIGV
jgi:hypothetical protein